MRPTEGREHQFTGIGLAGTNFEAGAAFINFPNIVDIGEIQAWVDAMRVEVQSDHDDVEITRAFTVTKECALDPISPSQHGQFGRSDTGATVVVSVQ